MRYLLTVLLLVGLSGHNLATTYAPEVEAALEFEELYSRLSQSVATCMEGITVSFGVINPEVHDCWDICVGMAPSLLYWTQASVARTACHDKILTTCNADVPCLGTEIPIDPSPIPTEPPITP